MATKANWTVVFDDKTIINQNVKNSNGHATGYSIDNDSFWNDSKWSNVWAIQYHDDNLDHNDTVEHRDNTPHSTWTAANLGDFKTQFINKWDTAHLSQLQSTWDNDNVEDETESEKITRLGARPTSYSS
tara:strand:+ start:332 stop:718 length:387 start_codon:yes stop_codon:yes gene_type:complete